MRSLRWKLRWRSTGSGCRPARTAATRPSPAPVSPAPAPVVEVGVGRGHQGAAWPSHGSHFTDPWLGNTEVWGGDSECPCHSRAALLDRASTAPGIADPHDRPPWRPLQSSLCLHPQQPHIPRRPPRRSLSAHIRQCRPLFLQPLRPHRCPGCPRAACKELGAELGLQPLSAPVPPTQAGAHHLQLMAGPCCLHLAQCRRGWTMLGSCWGSLCPWLWDCTGGLLWKGALQSGACGWAECGWAWAQTPGPSCPGWTPGPGPLILAAAPGALQGQAPTPLSVPHRDAKQHGLAQHPRGPAASR